MKAASLPAGNTVDDIPKKPPSSKDATTALEQTTDVFAQTLSEMILLKNSLSAWGALGRTGHWKHVRGMVSAFSSTEVRMTSAVGESLVQQYGPFHPVTPADVLTSKALTSTQKTCFVSVKESWTEEASLRHLTQDPWEDETILRVANFCRFDFEATMELLRRMEPAHWQAACSELAADFERVPDGVVWLPALQLKACQDVIYFDPSRFVRNGQDPSPSQSAIQLLTHVMHCITTRHPDQCRRKLGLVVNLSDYRVQDASPTFGVREWVQFMDLVQGQNGPVMVNHICMVAPHSDFGHVWESMKSAIRIEGFGWRFSFCKTKNDLAKHLLKTGNDEENMTGMAKHLPLYSFSEQGGTANMEQLTRDFIQYRQAAEQVLQEKSCLTELVQDVATDLVKTSRIEHAVANERIKRRGVKHCDIAHGETIERVKHRSTHVAPRRTTNRSKGPEASCKMEKGMAAA